MSKTKTKSAPRNPIKVAMDLRYGRTNTAHRHKNDRRAKAARRSWRNEES
mgnify:CR=1 FL=1